MRITATIIVLLVLVTSCSDTREYKIKFGRVEKLTEGDKIFIWGVDVGKIENVTVDEDNQVLVTISVTKDIKVTEGSKFILQSEFVYQHIEIELADVNNKLIEPGRLQLGEIAPMDTTRFRKMTQEEYDSVIRTNPGAKIADSISAILRSLYKDKKKAAK